MPIIDVNKAFRRTAERNNVGSESFQNARADLVDLFRTIKESLKTHDVNYDMDVSCKFEDAGTPNSGLRQFFGHFDVSLSENGQKAVSFKVRLQSDVTWKDDEPYKVKSILRFDSFDEISARLFRSEIFNRTQSFGIHSGRWREAGEDSDKSYEYLLQNEHYRSGIIRAIPDSFQQRIVEMVFAMCETLDASPDHGPTPPAEINEDDFQQQSSVPAVPPRPEGPGTS